jgi:hypothetical protein
VIRFIPIITFISLLLTAAAVPQVRRPSNRSRFTSAYSTGPWGQRRSPNRFAAAVDPKAQVPRQSEPGSIDSTQRPPERTPRVPPRKALHALCGIDAEMHIVPPPKLTSMRGASLASTPSSPSFRDWYKCGSRTRDTRFIKPLLYPSELTCGGMKQSGRAVRACTTRNGAQARQVGFTNPLPLHDRCFDLVTRPGKPQSQILHLVLTDDFPSPETTRPRSAAPSGVSWRDCSGDCHLVSPAT